MLDLCIVSLECGCVPVEIVVKYKDNYFQMETQKIIEFPHRSMDKRPRKRPRLTWDVPQVPPPPSKVKSHLILFVYIVWYLDF